MNSYELLIEEKSEICPFYRKISGKINVYDMTSNNCTNCNGSDLECMVYKDFLRVMERKKWILPS